jgi:hypothetical protein
MDKTVIRRLSISALVVSILAILASPIILIIIFGISWALADSGLPVGLSEYMLLYGLNSILYIMGVASILLGVLSIRRSKILKKSKAMSIVSIILGSFSVLIGVIFTLLIIFYFTW